MNGPHGSPGKLISGKTGFPVMIPPSVLTIVIRALHAAWAVICADPAEHLAPVTPGNPEEDRYTDALCEMLGYWLHAPENPVHGFTSEVFENVERGANLSNFDQSVINKQPDLVIRLANGPLVDARRYVGIFVEAKIVSMKRGLRSYTKDGVSRFVRGDYAWAMQDGLMIAYRAKPHRELDSLESPLGKDQALLVAPENKKNLVQSGLTIPASGKSTHNRNWTYRAGDPPGSIRVWHLWSFDIP